MITVDVALNSEGQVTDVIMDGHADYGDYGHDIVGRGGDDTLFAKIDGVVKFERKGRDKKQVSVYSAAE